MSHHELKRNIMASAQLQTPGWFYSWGLHWIRGWWQAETSARNWMSDGNPYLILYWQSYSGLFSPLQKICMTMHCNVARCEHTTLKCVSAQILHPALPARLITFPSFFPFPLLISMFTSKWVMLVLSLELNNTWSGFSTHGAGLGWQVWHG